MITKIEFPCYHKQKLHCCCHLGSPGYRCYSSSSGAQDALFLRNFHVGVVELPVVVFLDHAEELVSYSLKLPAPKSNLVIYQRIYESPKRPEDLLKFLALHQFVWVAKTL